MKVIICGGSPFPKELPCSYFPKDAYYIGADAGVERILMQGIFPNLAIGDFDSIVKFTTQELEELMIPLEMFPGEKNETDMELAMQKAVLKNPSEVLIYFGTGGRLDHYQSNLELVLAYQLQFPTVRFCIVDDAHEISFVLPGSHRSVKKPDDCYLSLYAFHQPVKGITLRGVKYEVTDDQIPIGSVRYTSNEIIEEEMTLHFEEGIVLMIRSQMH